MSYFDDETIIYNLDTYDENGFMIRNYDYIYYDGKFDDHTNLHITPILS